MKKFLIIFFVFFFSTNCFSLECNGDFQLHVGLNLNKSKSSNNTYFSATEFNIDFESWDFLKVNNTIDLGLMINTEVGIGKVTDITTTGSFNNSSNNNSLTKDNFGKSYHLNLLIGPALGYKIADFIRLNMSAGISVLITQNYQHLIPNEKTWISVDGIGFGANFQTKFFPNNTFSPICGCRFISNFFDNFNFKTYPKYSDPFESNMSIKTGNNISTIIYFGFSYNF